MAAIQCIRPAVEYGLRLSGSSYRLPQDILKALDWCIKAVELGSPEAGVTTRKVSLARVRKGPFCLSEKLVSEYKAGDHEVGIRHWKVAAGAGCQLSLLDSIMAIYNADGKKLGRSSSASAWVAFIESAMRLRWRPRARRAREKLHGDTANTEITALILRGCILPVSSAGSAKKTKHLQL